MKRVIFSNKWETYFSKAGLSSFEDFYHINGHLVSKNEKRKVITFHVDDGINSKQFYIKCFKKPHLKDIFFAWRRSGRLCSQGKYEWDCANFLLQNGIGTYKPVCYGEDTILGLDQSSFFVNQKLQGQSLTDFVSKQWQNLERREKEDFIKDLGVFVRKIHNLNINFPDLYLWHIFIDRHEDQCEFSIIDLHRMARNVISTNGKIKNLGRLDHSMTEKHFDQSLHRLFIESYAGNDWPGSIKELHAKVMKYSAAVSLKRKPWVY